MDGAIRRNQSANATGSNADKLANHVTDVTARPRIQSISERFRRGVGKYRLRGPWRVDRFRHRCLVSSRALEKLDALF